MSRSKNLGIDEFDENRMRFAHEEPPAGKPKRHPREDEDIEPLELGGSSGDRFGKLTDRDTSGSW